MPEPSDRPPEPAAAAPPGGVPDSDAAAKSAAMRGGKSKLSTGPLRFFLRGLAISLPAILTVVIVAWLLRGLNDYVLEPATTAVRYVIGAALDDSVDVDDLTAAAATKGYRFDDSQNFDGKPLAVLSNGQVTISRYVLLGPRAVPLDDYRRATKNVLPGLEPISARGVYGRLAEREWFNSYLGLNLLAIATMLAGLYFLGRFVSAKLGHWIVTQIETNLLGRLPVIRTVYGAVKQVTDFLFSESQVEYRRVIALEYPRRGIWSLGLVTGESMLQIAGRAGEPCLSVLIPSSPMPVTGYTVNVLRSEVLDLDLTVDQAFQFCISCGVLVPAQQKITPDQLARLIDESAASNGRPSPIGQPALPSDVA